MRTWDWPKMLGEMVRVTRSGGVIRLTDSEVVHESNSPKFTQLQERAVRPGFRAGHLFEEDSEGIKGHLVPLLKQHVDSEVYEREHEFVYAAGTPEGEHFFQDMARAFQALRPFFKKWGGDLERYDELYAEAMKEMQEPGFVARWKMLTAWAVVPNKK